MTIKDCFGNEGSAPEPWAYDPLVTYIAIQGAGDGDAAGDIGGRYVYLYNTVTDSWSSLSDTSTTPSSRLSSVSILVGTANKLYSYSTAYTPNKFIEYDPATDTWTPKTDPALGFFKKYYGCSDDVTGLWMGDSTGTFKHYETTTNTWTTLANTPAIGASFASSLLKLGNTLYLFDGQSTNYHTYDIATNVWTSNAGVVPLSIYTYPSYGSDGVNIYALAGLPTSPTPLYRFDGATWTTLASTTCGAFASVSRTRLNIIDGQLYSGLKTVDAGRKYSNIWNIYDIASDTWRLSAAEAPLGLIEGGVIV